MSSCPDSPVIYEFPALSKRKNCKMESSLNVLAEVVTTMRREFNTLELESDDSEIAAVEANKEARLSIYESCVKELLWENSNDHTIHDAELIMREVEVHRIKRKLISAKVQVTQLEDELEDAERRLKECTNVVNEEKDSLFENFLVKRRKKR